MSEAADYPATFLKQADPDRYCATLVLKERPRRAVTALYAFNADVASIPDRAREPAAGEIRLQWWRDALAGAGHGEVRQNPIAAALLDALAEYQLPAAPLLRLLEGRRFDLYHDPMPDVSGFEGYAGETASVMLQLAAMVLNGGAEIESGDAAGHLGVAQALVGHLRAFGFNASRGRIFLPWDIFATAGVSETEVLSGTDSEGLRSGLQRIAGLAREHLVKARIGIARLPRPLRPAFAPIALLEPQLDLIERVQNPFNSLTDIPAWQKIARMTWWTLRQG